VYLLEQNFPEALRSTQLARSSVYWITGVVFPLSQQIQLYALWHGSYTNNIITILFLEFLLERLMLSLSVMLEIYLPENK
jgi:hypothetical protein